MLCRLPDDLGRAKEATRRRLPGSRKRNLELRQSSFSVLQAVGLLGKKEEGIYSDGLERETNGDRNDFLSAF